MPARDTWRGRHEQPPRDQRAYGPRDTRIRDLAARAAGHIDEMERNLAALRAILDEDGGESGERLVEP